jgi:hypothetical protein
LAELSELTDRRSDGRSGSGRCLVRSVRSI